MKRARVFLSTLQIFAILRREVSTHLRTCAVAKNRRLAIRKNEKLSKTPKVAANLLFSITEVDPSGSNIVSLSTQNGKKLLDGILVSSTKPITARDQIGVVYPVQGVGKIERIETQEIDLSLFFVFHLEVLQLAQNPNFLPLYAV